MVLYVQICLSAQIKLQIQCITKDRNGVSFKSSFTTIWEFNSPSTLVFDCLVTLGSLRPTAFSPLTHTWYSVEGLRPSRVVEKTSPATTRVSNEDAGSEAAWYSTTKPVMGLLPSSLLVVQWTDIEVEDVGSMAKMVGAAGTTVCVMASKSSVDQTFKVVCQSPPSYNKNCTPFKFHDLWCGHRTGLAKQSS